MRRILIGLFTLPLLLSLLPPSKTAGNVKARPARAPHAAGEVIVKLRAGVEGRGTPDEPARLRSAARLAGERAARFGPRAVEPVAPNAAGTRAAELIRRRGLDRAFVLKFGPDADIEAILESLRADAMVEYAEPNYRVQVGTAQGPAGEMIPNDPEFGLQWGLRNRGFGVNNSASTRGADIKAPAAWAITTGDPDLIIAISDTGLDLTHPDIAPNLYVNPGEVPGNNVDDDGNGFIDDVHGFNVADQNADVSDVVGHGTQMAGIIAASLNNAVGVSGVCQSKIMPVRFFRKVGPFPEDFDATVADGARSLLYAVAAGASIINASWRTMLAPDQVTPADVQLLREAVETTNEAGVLLVCIAGNEGFDNDLSPVYPGAFRLPNQIVVAVSDFNDELWQSNLFIHTGFGKNSVHLAAPGVHILTTRARGECFGCTQSEDPEEWYEHINGTSASAAFVSGVAALVKAKYPDDHVTLIRRRILEGVERREALVPYVITGGRLSALGALTAQPAVSAPTIEAVKYKPGAGKLLITGGEIQSGAVVLVGDKVFALKAKGGKWLARVPKADLPAGAAISLRLRNPDGGTGPVFTFTR